MRPIACSAACARRGRAPPQAPADVKELIPEFFLFNSR